MQRLLGQNFLIDDRWIHALTSYLHVDSRLIWEFGAGSGNITRCLLNQGKRVIAFELDTRYVDHLQKMFAKEIAAQKLQIVIGDMIQTWKGQAVPDAAIGNLPFSEAADILRDLCLKSVHLFDMVVIMQKELADRLLSPEGRKSYSPLSILLQSSFSSNVRDEIPASSFRPSPHVQAVIVDIKASSSYRNPSWRSLLYTLTSQIFRFRRKTLRRVLRDCSLSHGISGGEVASFLESTGISLQQRAETVPAPLWWQLIDVFSERVAAEPAG